MVLCQNCKKNPAKVHYTEIVNDSMVAMNLCLECAEQKGIDVQKSANYGLGDLVAGLIDSTADSESERISRVRCSTCGYEYSDFKKIGRLGCPDCYTAFEAQLVSVLRHVHGSTHHEGKKAVRISERGYPASPAVTGRPSSGKKLTQRLYFSTGGALISYRRPRFSVRFGRTDQLSCAKPTRSRGCRLTMTGSSPIRSSSWDARSARRRARRNRFSAIPRSAGK